MPDSLQGRTVVIFGVANKRSIAWAIAQQMQQAGAQLAITYQNERLKQEADDLIAALPNARAFQCDVSRDEEIAQLFEQLKTTYGKLDALVHSVAFAPAEELKGEFVDTSREGFRIALDVSAYSWNGICGDGGRSQNLPCAMHCLAMGIFRREKPWFVLPKRGELGLYSPPFLPPEARAHLQPQLQCEFARPRVVEV